jgi:glycine/D-amino acid oxidase-like deaminating enzyme
LAKELDGESRYGYRKVSSLSMDVQEGKGTSDELGGDPLKSWLDPDNVANVDLIDDSGTAQVHPELFCHTLVEECINGGVKLIKGTAMSVKTTDQDTHLIQYNNEGGQIMADRVVLCTGPWSGKVCKELFEIDVPIHELAGHSIVLRTSKLLPPLAIFASVQDKSRSSTTTPELFSRPDGTIYIAGENCESRK